VHERDPARSGAHDRRALFCGNRHQQVVDGLCELREIGHRGHAVDGSRGRVKREQVLVPTERAVRGERAVAEPSTASRCPRHDHRPRREQWREVGRDSTAVG
jgi:hypothetical protein